MGEVGCKLILIQPCRDRRDEDNYARIGQAVICIYMHNQYIACIHIRGKPQNMSIVYIYTLQVSALYNGWSPLFSLYHPMLPDRAAAMSRCLGLRKVVDVNTTWLAPKSGWHLVVDEGLGTSGTLMECAEERTWVHTFSLIPTYLSRYLCKYVHAMLSVPKDNKYLDKYLINISTGQPWLAGLVQIPSAQVHVLVKSLTPQWDQLN